MMTRQAFFFFRSPTTTIIFVALFLLLAVLSLTTSTAAAAAAAAAEQFLVDYDQHHHHQNEQPGNHRDLRFGVGLGGGGIPSFANSLRATPVPASTTTTTTTTTTPKPLTTAVPATTTTPKPAPAITTPSPKPAPATTASPKSSGKNNAKTTATTDDDDDDDGNILANATVTLDPRFKWGGVANMVITGDNKYEDFMNYPSTSMTHCLFRTEFAPWIQIDLGDTPKLVYGVTLWHYWGDQRQYCSQGVQVSEDGETWNTIFNTGHQYGPAESPKGQQYTFAAQAVRYIRHFAGPSTLNNGVHFLRMEVNGKDISSDGSSSDTDNKSGTGEEDDDRDKTALRLVASENGKHLFATQNGKTYQFDKEEEEWNELFEDTWFQQVVMDSDHLVAVVNVVGQILLVGNDDETDPNSWELIQKEPQTEIADADEVGIIWAINDKGIVSRYKQGVWIVDPTTTAHQNKYNLVHIAVNHKGTYLVALSDDGKVYLKNATSIDNDWLEQKLPENAKAPKKLVKVTIGGTHEVWFTSEDGKVYHAWILEPKAKDGVGGVSKLHDWDAVDNQLQQIAALGSGTIYGVSMDGMGILYCPNRNPTKHSFRCRYIIGPLGVPSSSSVA